MRLTRGLGGHICVQGKARVISHSTVDVCLILTLWQGLQDEDFATLLRTGGNTVAESVDKRIEVTVRWRLDSVETLLAIGIFSIDTIEKKQVKVEIEGH